MDVLKCSAMSKIKLNSREKETLINELMEHRSNARLYRMSAKEAATPSIKRAELREMRMFLKRAKALHKALLALGIRHLPEYNYTGNTW